MDELDNVFIQRLKDIQSNYLIDWTVPKLDKNYLTNNLINIESQVEFTYSSILPLEDFILEPEVLRVKDNIINNLKATRQNLQDIDEKEFTKVIFKDIEVVERAVNLEEDENFYIILRYIPTGQYAKVMGYYSSYLERCEAITFSIVEPIIKNITVYE